MSQIESQQAKVAHPCTMVILGATGDLTKRLLYPSICNLGARELLDKQFRVIGVGSSDFTTDSFREQMKKNVDEFISDPDAKKYGQQLAESTQYIKGNFSDQITFATLAKTLHEMQKQLSHKNVIFYFASPPQCINDIVTGLNNEGLLNEENNAYFRRIIVEKPFGFDLSSAKKLNHDLLAFLKETQIFRIDHFLGKETVQNILAFRFSNGLFEPMWNHLYIDHIQITVSETLGVELRGGYYEQAGALRDMVPNHILQVLSLVAMEPPSSFKSEYIQAEKAKLLQSVRIPIPEEVDKIAVRGQYDAGMINNLKVPSYRAEQKIALDSSTETFAALKLSIDNWRWVGVPFYLRTGKRMKTRSSEITIQFKPGPSSLFAESQLDMQPNKLCLQLQPDEGISLRFNTKIPGTTTMQLKPVDMAFKYKDYFTVKPSTGYETILYEAMNGDHLLFTSAATVELGWAIVDPILKVWNSTKSQEFPNYTSGSWGPEAANNLIKKDGRAWFP